MRDRIIFFVLGALLATFAYFAGDMQLSAQNAEIGEIKVIPKLLVRELMAESITVGYFDTYQIRMKANRNEANIHLLDPNRRTRIALDILKTEGQGEALIAISDGTGKILMMGANGVNRFAKP